MQKREAEITYTTDTFLGGGGGDEDEMKPSNVNDSTRPDHKWAHLATRHNTPHAFWGARLGFMTERDVGTC